tara:strand:+ start:141 stop:437 length:297 start_codon:yes stop_codon:yes gene_type:complete
MVTNLSCVDSYGSGVGSTRTSGTQEEGLIEVEWLDIVCHADWTEADEVTCPTFRTIGWFISQDNKELKIGNTKDENDKVFGITSFPIGCIIKTNFLER